MTDSVARIQVDPADSPSTPSWLGEVAVVAHALQRYGVLGTIQERVRLVRARMGKYELIDFAVMLMGYAVSGEPTLRTFCERVQPFASAFMALFGRADLPTPPTLSRYLAVLDPPCVEALRTLLATHPAGSSRPPIGKVRDQTVYEQFFTTLPPTRLRLRMCSICICIGVRSRRYWLTKMKNKPPIAGSRERSGARSSGKSSTNGSGTSA